jgi:hypothetical protein
MAAVNSMPSTALILAKRSRPVTPPAVGEGEMPQAERDAIYFKNSKRWWERSW